MAEASDEVHDLPDDLRAANLDGADLREARLHRARIGALEVRAESGSCASRASRGMAILPAAVVPLCR